MNTSSLKSRSKTWKHSPPFHPYHLRSMRRLSHLTSPRFGWSATGGSLVYPFWPHDARWLVWTQALAVLLFSVVSAFAGVRLLYARRCIVSCTEQPPWLVVLGSDRLQSSHVHLQRSPTTPSCIRTWWVQLPSLISPVLFCLVVVGLLHTVRSRDLHGMGRSVCLHTRPSAPNNALQRTEAGGERPVPCIPRP